MIFKEKHITLRDGRDALLRSPCEDDAEQMLEFIRKASGETEFLLKFPEEYDSFTLEQEKEFINSAFNDPDSIMISCFVEGSFAGNCELSFLSGKKERHRASVAIAILKEFWGLGIGTAMFTELIGTAAERSHVRQLELCFIEGNQRARALYEKMGFRITGLKPEAILMRDGSFVNEYMMVRRM